MTAVLDWSRFDAGAIGSERAFEGFTAQLFERWLRREHGAELSTYVLYGAGGDGGVEAFARLDDGNVVGFQAKWFPGNVGDSRIAQIRASVDVARRNFPDLRRYVVALPRNLTMGIPVPTRGKIGKAEGNGRKATAESGKKSGPRKGGVERWGALITALSVAYPDLSIIRWDENGLLDQLAAPGNQELKALWFAGELTLEKVGVAWEKARAKLGQRYLPDLHAVGRFDDTLARDLWAADWLGAARAAVQRATGLLTDAGTAMADFMQVTDGRRDSELDDAIGDARQEIEGLTNHARLLKTILDSGPGGDLRPFPDTDALSRLSNLLERYKKGRDGSYTADLARNALDAALAAREQLSDVNRAVSESSRPRVVVGPAGCGKTHAAARAVQDLVAAGRPAVFLQGKGADPAQGTARLLSDALDLGGWPLARVLDGLEALAVLHHISVGAGHGDGRFTRAIVVIDGLEESSGWTRWTGPLADLAVESARRPRLHVVTTARPETIRRMTIPDGFSWLHLSEDGDVSLPDLLRLYSDRYGVDIETVPWLGWALRTPLEVRLLAEEFAGRQITATSGATTNVLTLFRHKLNRLEGEARERAGVNAWSEHLSLIPAVLEGLSDLTAEENPPSVLAKPLIQRLGQEDPEFTAERVRLALRVLAEHGLVDTWMQPAVGLRSRLPEYSLATRHVSDFVVASQCFRTVVAGLCRSGVIRYPGILRWRSASAVLFAAQLAERGHFLADITWDKAPEDVQLVHAQALALIPPDFAGRRRDEIRALLISTTSANRALIERLVIPVSRIPGHPLGPTLLDEALRSLPLAQRDPIWSVPEDLGGVGPWKGNYSDVLDGLQLSAAVDPWDGLALVSAWICSSVVEQRRRRAREMLAKWGSRRLDQMVLLLEHMAGIDDPQVVDDVVVAALGAAVGAELSDSSLIRLARLVDELFFAEAARAWTPSVVVRIAARGIVERAALMFPGEVDDLLTRARPPYAPRGEDWPSIDPEEVRENGPFGGRVVNRDLSWYVANGCFDVFSTVATSPRGGGAEAIEHSLLQAMEEGRLETPPRIAKAIADDRKARLGEAGKDRRHYADLVTALRRLHRERTEATGGTPENLDEDELLAWAAKALLEEKAADGQAEGGRTPQEPAYSDEFRALLRHVAQIEGIEHPAPAAVRNALIAYLVRSWGWSEEGFSRHVWDKPSEVVDDAIAQRHGSGASHGSRSAVCRFREKYVWAAVDRVAGELADRLPAWSDERHGWERLANLDGLGNGLPDPLPSSLEGDGRDTDPGVAWMPEGVLPSWFADEHDLARRAERWLVEADLPDPRVFVQGAVERWRDAAVLSLRHYRRAHQSCVDQLVQVRGFGVRPEDVEFLRRDAPFLGGSLYENNAWVEEGVYVSPALACWAPWLTWRGIDQGYNSFDAHGDVRRVSLVSAVGGFTARFEGEWPQEPTVWMPSPRLGRALGVVAMRGGRYLRSYVDRTGARVAVERDVPPKSFSFGHHYLAIELVSFVGALEAEGLIPVWAIQLVREATPALFMRGDDFEVREGLTHRWRDTRWLVVGNRLAREPEVILISDRHERWHGRESEARRHGTGTPPP